MNAHHHYNPDWLDDDALIAGFVARQDEFTFLRDELARAPWQGTVQHYLLVGVRGAGKTTLLKRLAAAIRQDADLNDHLIALSFPEELYQVKNLADFWRAACEALADELDRRGQKRQADALLNGLDNTRADPLSDHGLKHLLAACAELQRRPVLLVDNLDLVFQRIDKSGRKLKDPHAPAYWALREALSTATAPIVIGGSVRLSEPFTDYDKAFYEFFLPKRLGKLGLEEARRVLERLAEAQNLPQVKERLQARPSRLETLHDLTGGNPRALGLIFELLRQGPGSRAVEDFERLMDLTTPYYKARFEDLSEQAQVIMHALAVRRGDGSLRFGHTAAELGAHAGLPTGTVSAQLDILEREGLVEKNATLGRTQYRIAEQLFRLWLQMRGNRRIRQNVLGLTQFLEAMYDFEEMQTALPKQDADTLAQARYAFAVAGACCDAPTRRGLEAHGADRLLSHLARQGERLDDYLPPEELPEDLSALVHLREELQQHPEIPLTPAEQDTFLGAVSLRLEQKQASLQTLLQPASAEAEAQRLRHLLNCEAGKLRRFGLQPDDLPWLYGKRARGFLPLPHLSPEDAEVACRVEADAATCRGRVWRLLGAFATVKFQTEAIADAWLAWGQNHAQDADATAWANVAGAFRRSQRYPQAGLALEQAFQRGDASRGWYERATLLADSGGDKAAAESAYRQAMTLAPTDAWPWNGLGNLFMDLNRLDDAEAAFKRAMELEPANPLPWNNLGVLLEDQRTRPKEAEAAYRRAMELDPADARPWNNLGSLLAVQLNRSDEAEAAYRRAIDLEPTYAQPRHNLGILLATQLNRPEEAEAAYRRAMELDPADARPWNDLGALLSDHLNRPDEAEAAYLRAMELDPAIAWPWINLGNLLADQLNRPDEAEATYRHAMELDPEIALPHFNLGRLLAKLGRGAEAWQAYREGTMLEPQPHPWWKEQIDLFLIHHHGDRVHQALVAGQEEALAGALHDLLTELLDPEPALVGTAFVEDLLAPLLMHPPLAMRLRQALQDQGYERHARPLLLAYAAALEQSPERLDALEPELQSAARRMYARLTGQTGKRKAKGKKRT